MNKAIFIISLLIILLSHLSASAQRRGRYEMRRELLEATQVSPNDIASTEKKDIYRIDFLLPINLGNLPAKQQVIKSYNNNSLLGMNFYEGVLLAIDSLEKIEKMYYDVFVHDISTTSFEDLVKSGKLDSTDVIIGLLQTAEIPAVAAFAKERKINLISALSPFDAGVTDNPYFIIPQATIQTHMSSIIKYADFNKSYMNAVMLYRDNQSDEIALDALKDNVSKRTKELKLTADKIDLEVLKTLLIKGQKNLIYTTFLSPQVATTIISQLNTIAGDYELEIIGLPTWKGLPILTSDSLHSNLSIYLSYPFRFDEDVEKRLYMRSLYRKYNRGLPSEMVFRGYETTLLVADNLEKNGTIFNDSLNNYQAFSNLYKIEVQMKKNEPQYFENQNIYIYKYNNGKLNIIE